MSASIFLFDAEKTTLSDRLYLQWRRKSGGVGVGAARGVGVGAARVKLAQRIVHLLPSYSSK